MYFLMELVSGGELLDALDSIGLLKYSQAGCYGNEHGSSSQKFGDLGGMGFIWLNECR